MMQNEVFEISEHTESPNEAKEKAFHDFFVEAKKLHQLTEQLFENTPYESNLWPELWQYLCNRLKNHIPESSYGVLILNEDDSLQNRSAPVNFQKKLDVYDQAFDAEIPQMLKVIDTLRHFLIIKRRDKTYKASDIAANFSGRLINRPRRLPFPGYEIGVGLWDSENAEKKACRNGRETNRVNYMTTELVLMLSLLTQLPREEIFLALFPYKLKNNLTEEWGALRHVLKSYYYTLRHYSTMESMFDDLLILLGCYELYITSGSIKPDSEKIVVLLFSICRQAMKNKRYVHCLKMALDIDSEEDLLRQVFNQMFPKSIQICARLHRVVEIALSAMRPEGFRHIQKLVNTNESNGSILYPRFS